MMRISLMFPYLHFHLIFDCCPPGNKVIFQMPREACNLGHKQRAYFNFTSDGVGDVSRDEPGKLLSPSEENYPGVVYDFPKQVIKLRIGKTIEMANRKSRLEYQFVTPVVTHEKVVPTRDTRTAQCIPTCPDCCPANRSRKCALPRLPFSQELSEDQILDLKSHCNKLQQKSEGCPLKSTIPSYKDSQANLIVDQPLTPLFATLKLPAKSKKTDSVQTYSSTSICTWSKRRSVSFSDSVDYIARPRSSYSSWKSGESGRNSYFSKKDTTVYMTLLDDSCLIRNSGTQATASINKCIQVIRECNYKDMQNSRSEFGTRSDAFSKTSLSNQPCKRILRQSDVYFFGKKKHDSISAMGSSTSGINKKARSPATGHEKVTKGTIYVQAQCPSCSISSQTCKRQGTSAGTNPGKSVSIKDDKKRGQCPPEGTKGDMVVTVSHIRIGPTTTCPAHASCQGPKCIVANSASENTPAPVKVSQVTNPRRGVFELVIRRLNGAPLARNELMLEWTPPPSRPPPCSAPCTVPCSNPRPCRPPSKCKMIVCRPSLCKPKCCKKVCKKPCGPAPCRLSCRSPCRSPCGPPRCHPAPCRPAPCCNPPSCIKRCKPACFVKPCRPSRSCSPYKPPPCTRGCGSCPPLPCGIPAPCCDAPPCNNSPCPRPCPVGRKKPHRARSQTRMKPYKKCISPCQNRSPSCNIVRCKSGPCFDCSGGAPPCPPRKCSSVFPFKPVTCKSCCSSCCK